MINSNNISHEACTKESNNLFYSFLINNYCHDLQNKTKQIIKKSIIDNQNAINKQINKTEDKKRIFQQNKETRNCLNFWKRSRVKENNKGNNEIDTLVIKPTQSHQEVSNSSSILIDENKKIVETDDSIELWGGVKKWTGVRDLQVGIKNVKNGNYVRGVCEIAFGSMRIALTVYITVLVAQQIIGSFKGIEIPKVEKSQIQSESFNPLKGSRKITFITAYDEGIKDYAQYVIPNQRAFTAKHGYDYIEYYGNLAHDQGRQRAPYWSKIVAINDQLQKTKEGEWIAWGDASALFTNTEKNFDQIIEKYGVFKDIILTTDPQLPINNAVFLVKNTPWTKNWIKEVWERSDLANGGEGNCWSGRQPFCHYEQQAMTELWERNPEVRSHTVIIPNKEMNAFYRYSHYDPYRNMYQNYDLDPENSKWTPGDFICKVTGMDRDRRLGIIQHVANNCIDQNCDKIYFYWQDKIAAWLAKHKFLKEHLEKLMQTLKELSL